MSRATLYTHARMAMNGMECSYITNKEDIKVKFAELRNTLTKS